MRELIAVLMFILFAVRPVAAEELRPQLDDLVDHFVEVALGQEYPGLSKAPPTLTKWTAPLVGVHVQGRKSQALIDLASKHIRTISGLTGVRFRTFKPGETIPSIDLIFLKRAEMGNIGGPNVDTDAIRALASDPTMACFFLKWQTPDNAIVKAIVVANVEMEPARIDSCLLEELTQVMGLPNDVQTYWKTLFNPTDVSFAHSPWDALYLRTLYDPRLKPGMAADKVRAVVRPIFAEALSKLPKNP